MRAFLTRLIPKRMDTQLLCKVLREIWIAPVKIQQCHQNSKSQQFQESQKLAFQKEESTKSAGVLEPDAIETVIDETRESDSTVTDQVVVQKSLESAGSASSSQQHHEPEEEESKLLPLQTQDSQAKCCAS